MQENLIKYLSQFVTEHRVNLFDEVLLKRTRYMTVVLEDIYQSHNTSAVLRSCDCFGVQDVHIVEGKNPYKVNPDIALGASQWLTLMNYNQSENNIINAIKSLKSKGYRIAATTPHTDDVTLDKFDISKGKFALLFGTEQGGLTKTAINMADEFIKIPMFGFTESFNISVSAAIIMHHLTLKLRNSDINHEFSKAEKLDLKELWLKNTIKHSDKIVKDYYKKNAINEL